MGVNTGISFQQMQDEFDEILYEYNLHYFSDKENLPVVYCGRQCLFIRLESDGVLLIDVWTERQIYVSKWFVQEIEIKYEDK